MTYGTYFLFGIGTFSNLGYAKNIICSKGENQLSKDFERGAWLEFRDGHQESGKIMEFLFGCIIYSFFIECINRRYNVICEIKIGKINESNEVNL